MNYVRLIFAYFSFTIHGAIISILRLIFGTRICEFNRTQLTKRYSQMILKMFGIELVVTGQPITDEKAIFLYNHNSYLDIFSLTGMGLKNTRWIMSEKTDGGIGFRWCNFGNECVPIAPKTEPIRREKSLKEIATEFREGKTSLLVSPEGKHTFVHGIAQFNSEVFAMIQECNAPIQPMFIKMSRESNPLQGFKFKPGKIEIEFLPPLQIEYIQQNETEELTSSIRGTYLNKFSQVHEVPLEQMV